MNVRKSLADRLRSTQPGQAALKLLTRMSLGSGQVADVRFAAALHHDHELRRGALEKGALYLRDLGFYDHGEFARIHDAGAFFVSRLKTSVFPVVYKVYQGIDETVSCFEEPLDNRLSYGAVVDVDAFFRLDDGTERIFRVVQIEVPEVDRHDEPTGALRRLWLVANLDRNEWTVAAIAALYRLRYACIERLFRFGKHIGRLDHLDSGRMPVLLIFVVAFWILQTLADRVTQQLLPVYGFGRVSGDRTMPVVVEGWSDRMQALYTPRKHHQLLWKALHESVLHLGRHPNPSQRKRIRQVVITLAEQAASKRHFPAAAALTGQA